MRIYLTILAAFVAVQLQAQTEVEPFERVNVSGAIHLKLQKGDNTSYNALSNEDDLKISVKDGRLKICP